MKRILFFCVILVVTICSTAMAQTASNLDFNLKDGKVVITYALDYPADIKAYYSLDDGNTYKEITKATGDLGALITPSPMKRIDWDAFTEVKNLEYESDVALVIKVEAIANVYTAQAIEATKRAVSNEKADQYLIVRCDAIDAMIYIDSTGKGLPFDKGAIRIPIDVGKHSYRVTAPMYEPSSETVEILAYQNKEISVSLVPMFATVKIEANAGDLIYIDGDCVAKGDWSGRLMEGRHKLEARKDTSYLAMPYLYDAVRATKHTINLKNLIPAALMMIKSAEEGATIYIDDKDNGTTKSASLIAVGKHSIVLKKKGFENTDTTVMLEHGKVANITLAMQPVVNKFFATANIAYSLAPQMSYGLTVGSVKYWGWYLTAMTNFSFDFANHELASIGEGYYTGEEKTTRFAVTAGVIRRLNKMFYIKAGVGYGIRSLSWQKSDGNWVNIDGNSVRGLEASLGMQMMFGRFVFSLDGALPVSNFGNYGEIRIGVGYTF